MNAQVLVSVVVVAALALACGDEGGDKPAPEDPIIGAWKGGGNITWRYAGNKYALQTSEVSLTCTHPNGYKLSYKGIAASGPNAVNVEYSASGAFTDAAHKTSGDIAFASTSLTLKHDGMLQKTVNTSESWTYSIVGSALSLKRTQLDAQASLTLSKQ